MQRRLADFVASRLHLERVEINGLRPLPGGASRETWYFEATYPHDGQPCRRAFVLRRDPPGGALRGQRRDEFHLLQTVAAGGAPVPTVHWLADDDEVLGAP